VVVRFIDNGPGVPPELHRRIFDPFFTTKGVGQGTGLGLDTVQKVVRSHNGEVDLSSEPGHTEFRVALPAA
jgi:signal transduction histidine kinase